MIKLSPNDTKHNRRSTVAKGTYLVPKRNHKDTKGSAGSAIRGFVNGRNYIVRSLVRDKSKHRRGLLAVNIRGITVDQAYFPCEILWYLIIVATFQNLHPLQKKI